MIAQNLAKISGAIFYRFQLPLFEKENILSLVDVTIYIYWFLICQTKKKQFPLLQPYYCDNEVNRKTNCSNLRKKNRREKKKLFIFVINNAT